ncbi:MAG TPA: DUF3139 domain-containing protein [Bacillus sp. (in: firmicutes)]|nr:DUF3139 domain-containing protein [Bacillus sp. (in: firmicutes)]
MKKMVAIIGIIFIIGYFSYEATNGFNEFFNGSPEERSIAHETVINYLIVQGQEENLKESRVQYDYKAGDFTVHVTYKNEPFYEYVYYVMTSGEVVLIEILNENKSKIFDGKNGSVPFEYRGPNGFEDPVKKR